LIVPANNSVIEPEIWSMLPAGYAAYAARMLARGDLTADAVKHMEKDADAAAEALAATGVGVIAYCDMVTTFIMEDGWNEAKAEAIGANTGIPCISAWTALRDALRHLDVRRIALGTPYPASIHALVPPFFEGRGVVVQDHATLDVAAMREVPTIDGGQLSAFVSKLDTRDCDALVLLATDLPTFSVIEVLEEATGLPLLTSNQTLLWNALRKLGAKDAAGPGRLFRQ
jgi:maleate isomerase